jgi:CheY-like chemotaxis protein
MALTHAETRDRAFAVVLADCRLAIGDEYIQLQKLAKRPEVPIIGLWAVPEDGRAAQLHRIGMRHLLSEPVRPSTLFDAVVSVLAVSSKVTSRVLPTVATPEISEPNRVISGRILVAEDNEINQMYIVELLKDCGCTCDLASNGDEALAALSQKQYNLVLMDCQMPEMDGFTATREIRRREIREGSPRIPVIALTANALKGDRERCLASGMDDYLTKPLKGALLRTMLEKYLSPASSAQTSVQQTECVMAP